MTGERSFIVSANSLLEPDATTELVVRDCEAERCTRHGKRIVELVRWHGVDLATSPWWNLPIWHADADGCPTAPCVESNLESNSGERGRTEPDATV